MLRPRCAPPRVCHQHPRPSGGRTAWAMCETDMSTGGSKVGPPTSREGPSPPGQKALLRIELDDELLLDGHREVLAIGHRLHRALHPLLVQFNPLRNPTP